MSVYFIRTYIFVITIGMCFIKCGTTQQDFTASSPQSVIDQSGEFLGIRLVDDNRKLFEFIYCSFDPKTIGLTQVSIVRDPSTNTIPQPSPSKEVFKNCIPALIKDNSQEKASVLFSLEDIKNEKVRQNLYLEGQLKFYAVLGGTALLAIGTVGLVGKGLDYILQSNAKIYPAMGFLLIIYETLEHSIWYTAGQSNVVSKYVWGENLLAVADPNVFYALFSADHKMTE